MQFYLTRQKKIKKKTVFFDYFRICHQKLAKRKNYDFKIFFWLVMVDSQLKLTNLS